MEVLSMAMQQLLSPTPHPTSVALIWIDQEHAVIVDGETDASVLCLERELGESVNQFEARAVDRVIDDERVVVSGPAPARTSFERAYVAVTHRPDRLVEIEPTILGYQPDGASRRR
jgi:hypothetical protein